MIARWFWREWRSPSLLIVWLALSLAVACVLALGSISDRMEKGLSQQSREFMAGDRTLRSSREVPAEWIAQARKSGLTVGEQLSFATMTFAGDTPQLADVKAVDDRYPLYGTLETQPPGLKPQAGSVLLAPRLMALLNLKTGDTIDVGDATLRIAGEVIQEPDAGFNPFQMAPRLMMNMADVAKTGAVQPGSRVAWRYKFAGDAEQLANYEQWLLPKLGPEHRWIGLEQDDSALGKSLERSQQFLLLSALLTLLLAVAAVAVAMSHYCRSRYDLVAILKTLGAGRSQLRKLIVGQWLLLLTLSVITGGVAGLALERLLLLVLKPVLPAALPAASGWPWLWAIGATGVISLLVGLRPYRLLLATLPLRVLRQDVVANVWPLKIWIPAVSVVVVGLLAWLLGGSPLLWSVLAGAVVLALLCAVVSILFCRGLHGVEHLLKRTLKNPYLRVAVGAAVLIGLTLLTNGDYNGAGMEVIGRAIAGQADPWAWVWKLLFTAITIGCGFKGGEVVPSFFVGAAFGCAVSPLLGLPAPLGAALGMVALFCGCTNSPLASICLGLEVFGGQCLPLFALVCAVAYMLSSYFSLYHEQHFLHSKLRIGSVQFLQGHWAETDPDEEN